MRRKMVKVKVKLGNQRVGKGSQETADFIRGDYLNGMTQGALCRKYGYSIGQIGRIVRGEAWNGVRREEGKVVNGIDLSDEGVAASLERLKRLLGEEEGKDNE